MEGRLPARKVALKPKVCLRAERRVMEQEDMRVVYLLFAEFLSESVSIPDLRMTFHLL